MGNVKNLILPILTLIAVPAIGFYIFGGKIVFVFIVAFGGGLILYVATLWRREADSLKLIVPYLLTTMFFIAHVYEEYLTDFEKVATAVGGQEVTEAGFLTFAAFMAPMLWIGGAIMLIKRWAFGMYFLCAFFFAMTVAELAHFIFPFVIDGTFHYESGMYTAALPLIPAFYGLYIMICEIRQPQWV
ncbi:MAG: hypothetical protein O3A84_04710 [Proteobacteria bacterium]|nr:hypothetical protein [Pseudomonadota bacterium]